MAAEPLRKQVRANGININYWEWESDGPTIVLLHNSTGFGRIFDFVVQELHPKYHVIAPDQRGHGDTDKPTSGYSGEDYTDDFNAFIDAIGIDRCIVAGNSLGVRVGIIQAARRPESVSHLILLGGPHYSFLVEGADAEWWRNQSERIRNSGGGFASIDEITKAFQTARPSVSPEMVAHVIKYNTNVRPDGSVEWKYSGASVADGLDHAGDNLVHYIQKITCPILALRAETSWELTPERMDTVIALFPTAKWVTIKNAAYYLQLEQPKATADAIKAFLAENGVG